MAIRTDGHINNRTTRALITAIIQLKENKKNPTTKAEKISACVRSILIYTQQLTIRVITYI